MKPDRYNPAPRYGRQKGAQAPTLPVALLSLRDIYFPLL